jgi:hypothetical protein
MLQLWSGLGSGLNHRAEETTSESLRRGCKVRSGRGSEHREHVWVLLELVLMKRGQSKGSRGWGEGIAGLCDQLLLKNWSVHGEQ